MDMRKAFEATLQRIAINGADSCEVEQEGCDYRHFVDMYERIKVADAEGKPFSEAKLGRWLGWVQGAATACDFLTLEEAKEINQSFAGICTPRPKQDGGTF